MNNKASSKYSIAFTVGALLLNETMVAMDSLNNSRDFFNSKEELNAMILPINSEASRKRISAEIVKRMRALPDYSFIDLFIKADEQSKKLILFYAVCKQYTAILDFMIEVVVNKWNNIDLDISVADFQNFIFLKMDYHPELLKITDKTKYKAGQVALRILKEFGVLANGQLCKQECDIDTLKAISKVGDSWFLDLMFLNNMEKQKVSEA